MGARAGNELAMGLANHHPPATTPKDRGRHYAYPPFPIAHSFKDYFTSSRLRSGWLTRSRE